METGIKELVLDHLGIPRPGLARHVQELQDRLLPSMMTTARHAWLATSPMVLPNDSVHDYLQRATASQSQDIQSFNNLLEEIGVHDLLSEVAASPYAPMLESVPLDPYEERLLRASGHPKPRAVILEALRQAAKSPSLLTSSR